MALIVITAATAIALGVALATADVHGRQRYLALVHGLEPARARNLRDRRVPLADSTRKTKFFARRERPPARRQEAETGQALLLQQAGPPADPDRRNSLPCENGHRRAARPRRVPGASRALDAKARPGVSLQGQGRAREALGTREMAGIYLLFQAHHDPLERCSFLGFSDSFSPECSTATPPTTGPGSSA